MGQGLKGAAHTYAQFSDLVFGPLPANSDGIPRMSTLIGNHGDHAFQVYMDDHAASATDFESMFTFLHKQFSPCGIWPCLLIGALNYGFCGRPRVTRVPGKCFWS